MASSGMYVPAYDSRAGQKKASQLHCKEVAFLACSGPCSRALKAIPSSLLMSMLTLNLNVSPFQSLPITTPLHPDP